MPDDAMADDSAAPIHPGFPTVAEVLALDAVRQGNPRVVAGAAGLDRRVRWVHVTELTDVRPGQSATVTVDTYPGKKFRARVDSIQAGSGAVFSLLPPENATGNFVKVVQRVPVKLVFERGENAQHLLVPGMSVVPIISLRP